VSIRIHVLGATLFYAGLLGVALIWGALRGDVNVFVLPREPGATFPAWFWHVGIGIGIGAVAVGVARYVSRAEWARKLNAEFGRILGPLSLQQVAVLAVVSAVGEEAFFRGAMQPDLGYVPTSLIFGLLHIGPGREFWPWTLSALAAGFILGGITLYTGDIVAATLAHFTINYFNLWQLVSQTS
jgi:membrane protease YdiL (CAAX protease family)